MSKEGDDVNLSNKDRAYIQKFMDSIQDLGRDFDEPLDPKIEPLLMIIHSLLVEQLALDKSYSYRAVATEDDKYLDDTDIPSVDDLKQMMGDSDES